MSRTFRIYEKKRGDRRTGSGAIAGLGEAVFFGLFFLIGCVGLVAILAALIIPQWRANNEFVETTCVVRAKTLAETRGDDGLLYRPEITIEYRVDGMPRQSTGYDICGTYSNDRDAQLAALDQFDVGGQYRCWYDPLDPEKVALVRGYSAWTWLLLIVPGSFLLIGGVGFVYRAWHWGKSAERRSATGASPIRLRPGHAEANGRSAFPAIPSPGDITNSPGTTLQFRLPTRRSDATRLVLVVGVCLFWNAVAAVLVVDVVHRFVSGKPNWLETAVVAPLALAGLGLIYASFRQLLIATGIGPTLLEISDHPLHPSGKYEVFLSQAGRLRFKSIKLSLVATEEVRYRQGTDTRTESRCVCQKSLFQRDHFEINSHEPLEARCDLELPPETMHSFKSANNSLEWSLVVDGKVAGWPDYQRAFPVVIYPGKPEEAAR